ncbi:MAG: NUDIX domain-containing protein [Hyphomicrobiales bacterium]|nr:NUDIX domain-containing protein [Hyphomicrobiales bacterium]MBV9053182.1 NUDIX domain-containing protein [Hyphomicrobiales bacterium]MBV9977169.1 NUDIX domain-containing protein [Hyphomicrobiales bacterium]
MQSRAYPTHPLLATSLAVIRDGRILLATRTKPPAKGLFSLPGGLVEAGETLEEAALRELEEEVGVAASIVGFNDHVEVIERDDHGKVARHFVIASFVASWVRGEGSHSSEAGRVIWATPDDLGALPTTRGLERIAARAFEVIEANRVAGKSRR